MFLLVMKKQTVVSLRPISAIAILMWSVNEKTTGKTSTLFSGSLMISSMPCISSYYRGAELSISEGINDKKCISQRHSAGKNVLSYKREHVKVDVATGTRCLSR